MHNFVKLIPAMVFVSFMAILTIFLFYQLLATIKMRWLHATHWKPIVCLLFYMAVKHGIWNVRTTTGWTLFVIIPFGEFSPCDPDLLISGHSCIRMYRGRHVHKVVDPVRYRSGFLDRAFFSINFCCLATSLCGSSRKTLLYEIQCVLLQFEQCLWFVITFQNVEYPKFCEAPFGRIARTLINPTPHAPKSVRVASILCNSVAAVFRYSLDAATTCC